MIRSTYGDMAKWYLGKSQTTEIKSNLQMLSGELTSGIKADLSKHLGFNRIRVEQIDESIKRMDAYSEVSGNAKSFLETQQISLDVLEDNRVQLASISINAVYLSTSTSSQFVVDQGGTRFADMVRALGANFAGQSVFSGNKTDKMPLPHGNDILNDIKATINFSQPTSDVLADIKNYFTDPAGPYHTVHYQGGTSAGMQRNITSDKTISLETTATDAGIVETLAYTAAIAVADQMGNDTAQAQLISEAGGQLQTTGGVVNAKAFVGLQQEKVQRSFVQNATEKSIMTMERNDRVQADTFETATKLKQVETQLQLHYTMIGRLSELSLVKYV